MESRHLIALADTRRLLFDSEGTYVGTVHAPKSGLAFGPGAPTVLLTDRMLEASSVRIGTRHQQDISQTESVRAAS